MIKAKTIGKATGDVIGVKEVVLFFAVLLSFPAVSYAGALGMPQSTTYLGFGTNLNRVYANDSAGNTRYTYSAQPLSLFLSDWLHKDFRHLSEVYFNNYAFEANQSHIGTQVSQVGLRFSVQTHRRLHDYFAPWLGVGLDLSRTNFNKRHRVDNEGYLTNLMSDARSTGVNLLLNAMHTWKLDAGLVAATKLEYSLPLTPTISGISASVILFFKPTQQ